MSKLIELWKVLYEQQELIKQGKLNPKQAFKPGWKVIEKKLPDGTKLVTGLENLGFGKVEIVGVLNKAGEPLYDQFVFELGPADEQGKRQLVCGSIIIPYYLQKRFLRGQEIYIGLLRRIREVPIDPETLEHGRESLEFPAGFSRLGEKPEETALRELYEETLRKAEELYYLGTINEIPAFLSTYANVYAARVDPSTSTSNMQPDITEPIHGFGFLPYKKVLAMVGRKIFNGDTLSGLTLFHASLEQLK